MSEKNIRPFDIANTPNAYLWGGKIAQSLIIALGIGKDVLSPDSGNLPFDMAKGVIGVSLIWEGICTHNDNEVNRTQFFLENTLMYFARAGISVAAINMLATEGLSNLSTGESMLLGAAALSLIKTIAGIAKFTNESKLPKPKKQRGTKKRPKVAPVITLENEIEAERNIKRKIQLTNFSQAHPATPIPSSAPTQAYSPEVIKYVDPIIQFEKDEAEKTIKETNRIVSQQIAARHAQAVQELQVENNQAFFLSFIQTAIMMMSGERFGVDKLDPDLDEELNNRGF